MRGENISAHTEHNIAMAKLASTWSVMCIHMLQSYCWTTVYNQPEISLGVFGQDFSSSSNMGRKRKKTSLSLLCATHTPITGMITGKPNYQINLQSRGFLTHINLKKFIFSFHSFAVIAKTTRKICLVLQCTVKHS